MYLDNVLLGYWSICHSPYVVSDLLHSENKNTYKSTYKLSLSCHLHHISLKICWYCYLERAFSFCHTESAENTCTKNSSYRITHSIGNFRIWPTSSKIRISHIYQFVIKKKLRTFCVVMINVHFRHCRTLRKLLDLKQIFPSTNSVMFCQKYSTSKCENVTWKITT